MLTKAIIDSTADGDPLKDLFMRHLLGAVTHDSGVWRDAAGTAVSVVGYSSDCQNAWNWAGFVATVMAGRGWHLSLACGPDGCWASLTNRYRQFAADGPSVREAAVRAALLVAVSEQKIL